MVFLDKLYGHARRAVLVFRESRPLQSAAIVVFAFCLLVVYKSGFAAPGTGPTANYIHIANGSTVSESARLLENEGIISNRTLFKLSVRVFAPDSGVKAGNYFFKDTGGSVSAAYRLSRGDYGVTPVKITIPEGYSAYDIAAHLKKNLPGIDADAFAAEAKKHEGYLFPDTYFFLPGQSPADIVRIMRSNFAEKIKTIEREINAFDRPVSEIIIMASLLEKEARTEETRRVIAGILWKRLSIGMLLQVDATFLYINGKNTYELTKIDLAFDSPYNTYKYKGLPPGPISNPGLEAIADRSEERR